MYVVGMSTFKKSFLLFLFVYTTIPILYSQFILYLFVL